jgi:rod shape-determining protein MreC
VLHRETSSARRSLLVDRGRDHGLEPGMPVVQQDSLIGVVATASAGAARVLRIDDRAAATTFPATVLAGDADSGSPLRGQGVARGMGDGRIRVSFLPTGGARIGDLVVTGAGSRLVPEGLVLGEVEEVSDEERDGAFEAMVRPLRDLDAVASVHALRIASPGLRVEGK